MKNVALLLLTITAWAACSKENNLPGSPDIASIRANAAFTCTHEADRVSGVDPEAEAVFRYSRYLQKRDGPMNFDEVARYYRIAAAYGHYKANHNVQQLVSQ
jgi:hypothetical protein